MNHNLNAQHTLIQTKIEKCDNKETINSLGIKDEEKIKIAEQSVDEIYSMLHIVISKIPKFKLKKNIIANALEKILPTEIEESLIIKIISNHFFNAGANGNGNYSIELNNGAVIRSSSFCKEIAAIEIENQARCNTFSAMTTTEGGRLFEVIPFQQKGIARSSKLHLLVMLFLFGHEFAHMVAGHTALNIELTKKQEGGLSNKDRKSLEFHADNCAGMTVMGFVSGQQELRSLFGWNNMPLDKNQSQDLIDSCILANAIFFILIAAISKPSEKYPFTSNRFLSSYGGMIKSLETNSAKLTIPIDLLSDDNINTSLQAAFQLLEKTSMKQFIASLYPTNYSERERKSIENNLERLYPFIDSLRGFGINDFVEKSRS